MVGLPGWEGGWWAGGLMMLVRRELQGGGVGASGVGEAGMYVVDVLELSMYDIVYY